jgi:hypothetical protein
MDIMMIKTKIEAENAFIALFFLHRILLDRVTIEPHRS